MTPTPSTGSVQLLRAVPNLDGLFAARVRLGLAPGGALGQTRGSVVFEAPPAGAWTLRLHRGKVTVLRGAVRHPTTTIHTDPHTLAGLLEGRRSGVDAFLAGDVTVRGNLALALQVDGSFDVGEPPAHFPRARVVDVHGIRTGYLEAGPADAPPVLLLHGLGATNASMLPLVASLARDHRVIAPDAPGFGSSQAPRWRYTFNQLDSWLSGFQEAIGAPRAALVGNSMGGRMALEAGLSRPSAVERLVLLCPSPAFLRLRQLVPVVRLLSPELSRLPVRFPRPLVMLGLRSIFAEPSRLPRSWYDAAVDEFQRVMRAAAHRRACAAALRQIYVEEAYGERGFWERLPGLHVPSLFVWGQRDPLVPAAYERHVVAAVPAARSVVVPDCGHVPQYEWPEETARLTRDFLDVPGRTGRRSPRRAVSGGRTLAAGARSPRPASGSPGG
jgi:pimeloyl-ACP methyl ester carboxylesterase